MRVKQTLLIAAVIGCGGSTTQAPAGTTVEEPVPVGEVALDDTGETNTPTGEVVWHMVDDLGESEQYVILGSADAPSTEGRRMDGGEVDTFLHEVGGDVPSLTLLGYRGACTPTRARRVVIVRQIDPEDPYVSGFDAVAVHSECEPVLAVEGEHPRTHLVPLEISDPPFGEPIIATGEGWTARFEYGPSEDGICPGYPLRVEVSRDDETVLTREFPGLLSFVRIVTLGERAWLLLGALETAHLIELGGDAETRFSWPNGVDLAQIC